jgi:predicted lipid-binding transport protein (Tim44 family)
VSDANQTKPADTADPFLKLRSRVTKNGALAGLTGTLTGLLVAGLVPEIIYDSQANATNPNAGASGIFFISIFLTFFGYPLIGVVVGALIGRLSVKRDNPEEDGAVFQHALIGSMIAGLLIGILPIALFLLYILRFSTG